VKTRSKSLDPPDRPSPAPMAPGRGPAPPAGQLPWLRVAMRSDIGRVRQDNQDTVFGLTALLPAPSGGPPLPFGFFAVADGMGGLSGGALASRTAIGMVSAQVVQELLVPALSGQAGSAGQRTVAEILTAALCTASSAVFQAARRAGAPSGTTFSGAILLGRQVVTAHVGDSRIYLGGPQGLTPLTEDHSMVARLVALGQFTPEEARSNPQRNVLYRSLGQADQVEVQSASHAWRGQSHLLLCSDGLWDLVGDADLAAILRSAPDLDQAADALIAAANAQGGPDNISVILVQLPQEPA